MMVEACIPNVQADSLIVLCFRSQHSNLIYGNDGDYYALLGSKCKMIWNVQNKKGRQSGRKRPSSESSDEATKSVTSLQVELYGADNDKMHNYQAQLKTRPKLTL